MKKQMVSLILIAMTNSYIQTMDNSEPIILTQRCYDNIKNYIIATMLQTQNCSLSYGARNTAKTGRVFVIKRMIEVTDPEKRRQLLTQYASSTALANTISIKAPEYHATLTWIEEPNYYCCCSTRYQLPHAIGMIIPGNIVFKEFDPKERLIL
ncbi:MAG TPA: hypothetical protein VLG50_00025 [Candidatus Saccharimonadales bacterium]|nr:hypothetical protein [Candidatus Saccharimonadales bacterium]